MVLEQVTQFFGSLVSWPILPASILMLLILLYGGLVLLGAVDLDLFDFEIDVESEAAHSIGFVTLRFLNLGDVPLMVWLSTFGFLWWVVSILFAMLSDTPPDGALGVAVLRQVICNLGVGVLLTKAATDPMERIFAKQATRHPEDLIGHACEVSTYEVTLDAGQARFPTEAAPLLLNVRTEGEPLRQGEAALIIDYNPETKLYLVAAPGPGSPE